MLTRDETVDLLTAIAAYDNRKPNAAALMAWGKAAELGRWTFPEALDAVHEHFAASTEYLMPAHITALVKAARQDRAMRDEALALEAGPVDAAAAATVQRAVEQVAQQLQWDLNRRENAALAVACPACRAPAGQRCVLSTTGKPLRRSSCHDSRAVALADQLKQGA
jgi:hypothetical protein